MNEEFLSYLWKYRQLYPELKTTSGDLLTVLHPGEQNTDGGPDFFNARLRIGSTLWAGNVEIHICSSHWYKHGHQVDHAYDNTILHVVYENDIPVYLASGEPIQTLVVNNQFPGSIYDRYLQMMLNQQWIPCFNQLKETGGPGFHLWAPALAVERLACKAQNIKQMWENCRHDWEEAYYQNLASSFGLKINSLPFEMLARSLPLKVVRKHSDSLFQLEALVFGQSGMLAANFREDYPRSLQQEYLFLKGKYNLKPIPPGTWKFLRLRPVNFPTLRISQWASVLGANYKGFADILEGGTLKEVLKYSAISASEYWDTHYVFGKTSHMKKKVVGKNFINTLIINGIVPFMFCYGLERDQPGLRDKALCFLEQAPGEQDAGI